MFLRSTKFQFSFSFFQNNEGGVEGVKKDDKNKGQKELVENGNCGTTVVQQNGGIVVVQNGTVLDDDKTFK